MSTVTIKTPAYRVSVPLVFHLCGRFELTELMSPKELAQSILWRVLTRGARSIDRRIVCCCLLWSQAAARRGAAAARGGRALCACGPRLLRCGVHGRGAARCRRQLAGRARAHQGLPAGNDSTAGWGGGEAIFETGYQDQERRSVESHKHLLVLGSYLFRRGLCSAGWAAVTGGRGCASRRCASRSRCGT